jgi:type 1 glutamine amidotransferase
MAEPQAIASGSSSCWVRAWIGGTKRKRSGRLESIGKKSGAFASVTSGDLAMYLPEHIRQFDAIVMNNSSGGRITPTDADMARDVFRKYGGDKAAVEQALRTSLLQYVRRGGGIVSLHYAIAANAHRPEFKELLGARFTSHPWNEEIVLQFYLDAIQFAAGDLEAPASLRADRPARQIPGA